MKFILFFLLLFQTAAFSQANKKDSLLNLLEKTDSKEEKISLYLNLAKNYRNTQIDSAIYFAEQGYKTAKQINSKKGIAENADVLGDLFVAKNQFNKANFYYSIAANYYKKNDQLYDYCKIRLILGNINLVQSNIIKALLIYRECLDISKKQNYKDLIADLNNNLGSLYFEIRDYKEAEKYFKIAYKLFVKQDKKQSIAMALSNISNVQNEYGNYKASIKNYQEVIKILSKTGNWEDFVAVYNALAANYINLNEYDKAEKYANLALKIVNQNKKSTPDYRGPISLNTTSLYYRLALIYIKKNELDKSLEYAHKSLKLCRANSYKNYSCRNAQILYEVFDKKNIIDSTLFYSKMYIKYSDMLNDENTIKEITQLKMQYKLDDIVKNIEIENIKSQANTKRNELIYLGISIFTILGIIIMILLYLYQKSKTVKLALLKEKLELEKITLNQDIEYKSKELTSNVMYLLEKNEFIISLAQKLKVIKPEVKKEFQNNIQELINELNQNSSNKIWNEFEMRFKEVHSDFYKSLNKSYPDLTPNEIKICAFLRLNMSTKDISAITHQSIKSINMARFRLRKKLDIESDENLINFLTQLP